LEKHHEFEPENQKEVVERFEKMLKRGEYEFLDLSTFEYLIEHYAEKGDFSKALSAAKVGYKQYPYSVEMLTDIASIMIETGRSAEAEEYIDKAEIFAPNDADVLMLKGVILLDQEQFDDAIAVFERLLPEAEDPSEVYYHMGMAYFGKEDTEKSIECFKESIKADSKNEEAIFDMVNVLDTLDMLEETIPFYEEIIDEDPFNQGAWYNLGIVYDRLFKFEKAIECYEYAIALEDNYGPAHFNMACSYMAMLQYAKAIESFREALKCDNFDDGIIYVNLGMCYLEVEDIASATKEFHSALKMNHDNYMAYFGIARCLDKQEKWMEAIHFLSKATKYFDSDVNVWLLQAKCEYSLGHVISAVSALLKASELEPEITEIWLDWSFIVSEQGDYQQALEIVEKGITHMPDNASLYYRAVVYLIKASKYKEGFIYLENALTLDFEKHAEMFEFFPELETQKALMKIIDQFSEGDVR
jgi:tetratricopeptide (TPR) repeat protein